MSVSCVRVIFFFPFFNDTATTEIYTLSLHDALPIWNIDRATDVLSFPLIDYTIPGNFDGLEDSRCDYFDLTTDELLLGDIVISIDKVYEQATEYNHSKTRELAFLVAHSMLHLSGYDHMEDDERRVMEEMQEKILTMKGYTRDYEEN